MKIQYLFLFCITFFSSLSMARNDNFSLDKYNDISQKIHSKLDNCEDLSIDNYSFIACKEQAIKDFDLYIEYINSSIQFNIANNKELLSQLENDIQCDGAVANKFSDNKGNMWASISLNYCILVKDVALKKWVFIYDNLKGSEHYHKNTQTIFD